MYTETETSQGQVIHDPAQHFKDISWCADLPSNKRSVHVAIPDRRPKLDGEYTLVKETLNGETTVRTCITYFRVPLRKQKLRLGEDKKNPFVEISTLLDIGSGVNSYAETCHGGFTTTTFDEIMGKAVWQQSGGNYTRLLSYLDSEADFMNNR